MRLDHLQTAGLDDVPAAADDKGAKRTSRDRCAQSVLTGTTRTLSPADESCAERRPHSDHPHLGVPFEARQLRVYSQEGNDQPRFGYIVEKLGGISLNKLYAGERVSSRRSRRSCGATRVDSKAPVGATAGAARSEANVRECGFPARKPNTGRALCGVSVPLFGLASFGMTKPNFAHPPKPSRETHPAKGPPAPRPPRKYLFRGSLANL